MSLRNLFKNSVFKNASWIIVCKVFQSLCSILITIISARFLGPSNYGVISYATSLAAFILPIALLGLNNVQVQAYVNHDKSDEGKILGTSVFLSFLSSIICILGIFVFTSIVNYGDSVTIIVCLLYSLILLFQSTELVTYWYQSKLLSKYTALVSFVCYLLVSSYKLLLLIFHAPIFWLAISNAIDYFLISVVLIVIFKIKTKSRISIDFGIGKELIKASKHYIIPNMMIAIFSQTDHILLKNMIGNEENGFYTAALTCSTSFSFIFVAFIDSFRPSIFLHKKNHTEDEYQKMVSTLYSIIILFGLLIGITECVFSKYIIRLLFGEQYSNSTIMLFALAWFPLFSYMGTVRDVWCLAEGKHTKLWIVYAFGVILNVSLDVLLIPIWGGFGAALASVFTQFLINFVCTIFIKRYRPCGVLLIRGLNFPRSFKALLSKND